MSSWRRKGRAVSSSAAVVAAGLLASLGVAGPIAAVTASPAGASQTISSTGLTAGSIKHVWLIILENKSYDETFTGLNQNTYLWTTLPAQGALLTNYYGTGHFSMDNYISLVSGQAPSYDVQDDCSTTAAMVNNNSGIITTGTIGTATDTDSTADGSGTHTVAPTTGGSAHGKLGQILPFGGVD